MNTRRQRFVQSDRSSSGWNGYFFFFFLLRRSSRRSRRFAPATLTAEPGLPTRASASVTVRTVTGSATLDAIAKPKRPNTPRRDTNSDFIFPVMMNSRPSQIWLIDTPIEGERHQTEPQPIPSRFQVVRIQPKTILYVRIVLGQRRFLPLPRHVSYFGVRMGRSSPSGTRFVSNHRHASQADLR